MKSHNKGPKIIRNTPKKITNKKIRKFATFRMAQISNVFTEFPIKTEATTATKIEKTKKRFSKKLRLLIQLKTLLKNRN